MEHGEMILQKVRLILMEAEESGQRDLTEWMGFEQELGRKIVIKMWTL